MLGPESRRVDVFQLLVSVLVVELAQKGLDWDDVQASDHFPTRGVNALCELHAAPVLEICFQSAGQCMDNVQSLLML